MYLESFRVFECYVCMNCVCLLCYLKVLIHIDSKLSSHLNYDLLRYERFVCLFTSKSNSPDNYKRHPQIYHSERKKKMKRVNYQQFRKLPMNAFLLKWPFIIPRETEWYRFGLVRPSVRPSVCLTLRVGVL